MRKDTAKKYAIHAIDKIKDYIEKEGLYCIAQSKTQTFPKDLRDSYAGKADLCRHFVQLINNKVLDEFENNERGEYNFYD